MKISNLSELQMPVDIVGAHGDKNTVLLQPRGTVELPEGYTVVNTKLRKLYIHPETTTNSTGNASQAVADAGDEE